MDFDLAQTDHLLTTTRAVRKRLDLTQPVPRKLILECIRVSTQSPAGGNYQKWRWVVVDDPDRKAVIADAYVRSRLDGDWGAELGTLSPGLDLAGLAQRACPSTPTAEAEIPISDPTKTRTLA